MIVLLCLYLGCGGTLLAFFSQSDHCAETVDRMREQGFETHHIALSCAVLILAAWPAFLAKAYADSRADDDGDEP